MLTALSSLRSFSPANAVKQPEHMAAPAFNEAQDKIAFLESRLSEAQKAQYEDFVKAQDKEKEEQKQKAARAKAAYDQAREKHPHLVKNYDPPVKIKDPHLQRLAVNAQTEHQKVSTLERTHMEDKVRMLEKLDQRRETQAQFRDDAKRVGRSPVSPEFARAAGNAPQPRTRESPLSRAFEKAQRQQEQARQRTRTQEHGRDRARGRD